jgi:hypothetical protein
LFSAAVKKYVLATRLALDQGNPGRALDINRKAIKYYEGYDKSNTEDIDVFNSLECALTSISGRVGLALSSDSPGNRNNKYRGAKSAIAKIDEYLLRAIQPICSRIDPETGDIAIDSLVAMHALSTLFEKRYKDFQDGI